MDNGFILCHRYQDGDEMEMTQDELLQQIESIQERLDSVGVPREYMGVESSPRERVAALVNYMKLRGLKWPQQEQGK